MSGEVVTNPYSRQYWPFSEYSLPCIPPSEILSEKNKLMAAHANIFLRLFLYSVSVFTLSAVVIISLPAGISLADIILPCIVFPVITALSYIVFLLGSGKDAERQPLYTAGSIGLKFFFTVVFALVYFAILKNTGTGYIILFFLLYLAFTIYLLLGIVKRLKIKSLK